MINLSNFSIRFVKVNVPEIEFELFIVNVNKIPILYVFTVVNYHSTWNNHIIRI